MPASRRIGAKAGAWLLLVAAGYVSVSADAAPMPEFVSRSGALGPGPNCEAIRGYDNWAWRVIDLPGVAVSMEAETVDIHLCPTMQRVRAVFHFTSPDTSLHTMTVGFPDVPSESCVYRWLPFERFTVSVNGSDIDWERTQYVHTWSPEWFSHTVFDTTAVESIFTRRRRRGNTDPTKGLIGLALLDSSLLPKTPAYPGGPVSEWMWDSVDDGFCGACDGPCAGTYHWREFPMELRDGRARLVVSYTQPFYVGSYYELSWPHRGERWPRLDTNCTGCLYALSSYVLRTGSLWKGPIGSAVIRVHASGLDDSLLAFLPQPHSSSDTLYEWDFTQWEPQEDLLYRLRLPPDAVATMAAADQPYEIPAFSPEERLLDYAIRVARLPRDDSTITPVGFVRAVTAFQRRSEHPGSVRFGKALLSTMCCGGWPRENTSADSLLCERLGWFRRYTVKGREVPSVGRALRAFFLRRLRIAMVLGVLLGAAAVYGLARLCERFTSTWMKRSRQQ